MDNNKRFIYSIKEIEFAKTKKDWEAGKRERGILFNEGEFKIMDSKGKLVNSVWDYRSLIDGFEIKL